MGLNDKPKRPEESSLTTVPLDFRMLGSAVNHLGLLPIESSLWRDNPVEIQCALILGCGSRHVVLPFKRHLICERPILEGRR